MAKLMSLSKLTLWSSVIQKSNMGKEIERKFLVTGPFKDKAYSSTRIVQGYICHGGGRTVRVRLRNEKGYLTIKGPSIDGGLSRYEFEIEISFRDAMDLMKLCKDGYIDKTRYLVKSGKHTFEVDEFYGDNEGLIMAVCPFSRSFRNSVCS